MGIPPSGPGRLSTVDFKRNPASLTLPSSKMKLLLVTIVIFAAIHYGQADETACDLEVFDHNGMEKFREMDCESYMENGQFNIPTKMCKMAAFGIGNGLTTDEEWVRYRDAETEEEANEAAYVLMNNLENGMELRGEQGSVETRQQMVMSTSTFLWTLVNSPSTSRIQYPIWLNQVSATDAFAMETPGSLRETCKMELAWSRFSRIEREKKLTT